MASATPRTVLDSIFLPYEEGNAAVLLTGRSVFDCCRLSKPDQEKALLLSER